MSIFTVLLSGPNSKKGKMKGNNDRRAVERIVGPNVGTQVETNREKDGTQILERYRTVKKENITNFSVKEEKTKDMVLGLDERK